MIAYDLAFELNSKSVFVWQEEPLPLCFRLGKELGCHKYSIGSDGHKLEHFRLALIRFKHYWMNLALRIGKFCKTKSP